MAGKIANLGARSDHPEDGLACDHAHHGAIGYHRHLVDVIALHALEQGQHGFFGRSPADLLARDHRGLH